MTTRIIMRNDGRATAEGETEIFGTNGAQTVTVLDGATVTFRSGFNTGGDTIRINGRASDFTVSISGSNVTFRSTVDNITVVIPIGTTANTIVFDNGDSRSLSLVGGTTPTLGTQTITAAGVAVTAGPGTFSISGAASANEGGVFTYTVTRTDTSSAETLLFSVDGSTNGGVVAPATQGADFSPASGVVTFAAGAATATFTVAVASDGSVEGLEGISVRVVRNGAVVASTNGTIIDGNAQGLASPLSAGVDNIVGTGGNDTITGRLSEFSSLDTVTGGAGIDTLVLTGILPADFQPQPEFVLDSAFERTTGIERLVLTGGTLNQSVNADLGPLARAAGLTEVVAGGTGNQFQFIDIQDFDGALTVTGSGNAETIAVNLGTAGAKTLNLGGSLDTVFVTTTSNVAGSVQVNFTSASVGNGTNDNVTIVSPNGNVIVNDEGTVIEQVNGASVFNVVGLGADGAVDPAQNRGNFGRIELGTGAGENFATNDFVTLSTYFNAGAGNDTFTVRADAGERHFAVGGTGSDTLNATTTDATGLVVGIMGADNDTVVVGLNAGSVDINLGDGDDSVRFNNQFVTNLLSNSLVVDDVVAGGAGRDTLIATSGALTAIDNTATQVVNFVTINARQSVSGFEVLTVSDVLAANLTTGRIQAGIDTVNLTAGIANNSTVTFDSGLAGTLNLAASAGFSGIRVASAGSGSADQVTIANTSNAVGGVAQNVFNGQAIITSGVETLVINTTSAGSATTQTIGGISGTAAGRVNFVGDDSVNAGTVDARTVDASGLTGTARINATTTNTDNAANAFTGSANGDTIILGAGRQNLNAGAGNDTVVINAVNNLGAGTSRLNGGDGIDTLQMNTADAVTLSVTNIFNANNSGFEVLSLNRQPQGPANGPGVVETIRIDNIGTGVNKVISAGTADGTPGTGNVETATFNAVALQAGQSLQVVGGAGAVTVTAPANGSGLTADQVAQQIRDVFNSNTPLNAAIVEYVATGTGSQVVLTGTTLADQPNVTVTLSTPAVTAPTYAVTQGVNPIPAVAEVTTLVLDNGSASPAASYALRIGDDTVVFNGKNGSSFNFSSLVDLSGETPELANAIKAAADADADWFAQYETAVVGNNVTFTARVAGDATDITITDPVTFFLGIPTNEENLRGETLSVTTSGANLIPGTAETTTVTWQTLLQGQSVTLAGRTVTATTRTLTAAEVADAFEDGQNGLIVTFPATGAQVSGTLTGWTLVDSNGDTTTAFTSTAAGNLTQTQNVADLSLSQVLVQSTLAPTPAPTIVNGLIPGIIGPAGTLILQNLDSNGTLEITANSIGTHEVRITDSGLNLNDVLNLELTNSSAGTQGYGTVVAANVERVNVITKDTGTGNDALATLDNVTLNIAQATTLTVSGNNGLFIAQNAAGLTLFDASGIVGNLGDSRANLGVTFFSQNTTAGASVTMIGGIGNDDLFGTRANDTFDLTRGGSDLVAVADTRANNGLDVVNGFTAGGASNAGADVLDFVANTVVDGNGATAGLLFNATTTNTGDLTLSGFNQNIYLVTDGAATLNLANVKDFTAATGSTGEILLTDGASAYVLHAASAGSNTFTIYRVFDGNGAGGTVDVRTEILGTVNLTNTFGDLTASNFDSGFAPTQAPLTAAEAAASAPIGGSVAMLENLGSFAIV